MTALRHTRNADATESDNRMAWTLAETGAFPSREQLRAIREHREDERHAAVSS